MKESNSLKGSLTFLTGRSGSGKSTLAKDLQKDYDLVIGADTGFFDPGLGKWYEPTPEEKASIREDRTKLIQDSLKDGKNVLFEGAPGVAIKYPPSLLQSIHQIIALDADKSLLRKNVIQRSKARGSYYDKEGRKDDLATFNRLYQNFDDTLAQVQGFAQAPIEWRKMDYKKTAATKKKHTASFRREDNSKGTIDVRSLFQYVKDLPVQEMNVSDVIKKHDKVPFLRDIPNHAELAKHFQRAMDADTSFPVLLSPKNHLVDGHHRILQKMIKGESSIGTQTVPWDMLSRVEVKKPLMHAEQRMQERAPGNEEALRQVRQALKTTPLQKQKTYSIPLPQGQGYVVVGDIGKKHVIKTVLGPEMRPPGEILRLLEQEKKASVEVDRLISLFLRGAIKP